MFMLIAIGMGAAFAFSAVAMDLPGLFPDTMQHEGKVAIYFEAAAMVTVLVLLGQVLELRARSRKGSVIKALLNLAPPTARQVANGGDHEVPLDQVRVGDWLRVVPGDKVLADGEVWIGPEPKLAHAIVNAVAVLIVACPCATGLATPMSIMVGVGRGAQEGVLVKNAEALEQLEKVTTLVVDKTSALTEDKPKLIDILPVEGFDAKDFLRLAASLKQNSEHPLATASVQGAKQQSLNRQWDARTQVNDELLALDGRVLEMLSEHQCQGWLEGYLLTGRHGLFNSYEAFVHIVDSMFNQHTKWLKVTAGIPWRHLIASLNYLLASHV